MLGQVWRNRVIGVLREWPDNEMQAQDVYDYLAGQQYVMPSQVRAFSEILSQLVREGIAVKHGHGSAGVWYAIAREPHP
jgi:hypothetical protein